MIVPLGIMVKQYKLENALRDMGKKVEVLSQLLDGEIEKVNNHGK